MAPAYRLRTGGRIDRSTAVSFTFDGSSRQGFQGDTLASALLVDGPRTLARSTVLGRPRGVFAAGGEEPNAVVETGPPTVAPFLPATTVELYEQLSARQIAGVGRLGGAACADTYDRMHHHCDVLVIGGGPAGLAAGLAAAASDARVMLVDDGSELGGDLLATRETLDEAPAADWVDTVRARLDDASEVHVLTRTTVLGAYDDGYFVALERRTDHLGNSAPRQLTRQRVWHIRARHVVLASGAHERSVAFADNDRPGVMLAGAARTYLNRYGVAAGRRAVVFTTNDSAYAAALDLAAAGVEVGAVVDARPEPSARLMARCRDAGIDVLAAHVVIGTSGEGELSSVTVARMDADGALGQTRTDFSCDLLAVSGGHNPVVALYGQGGGGLRFDHGLGTFVPAREVGTMTVAGSARGLTDLASCLRSGAQAGARAVHDAGFDGSATELPGADVVVQAPPRTVWVVPYQGDGEPWTTHFVDLARDSTVADVRRATQSGMRSVEHVKRHTTIGTGHDQGKTSGVLASGVVAHVLDVPVETLGTTSFRAPYSPVTFAALAGRDRGRLHDPIRVTALHSWHVAAGAEFEDVGQWKRPRYFPSDGGDLEEAVLRECRAVRNGVGMMDASTLGKIDVRGPDAAEFLDRVYTNMMSSLKVGSIRYGVMCRADGMVFDDGTAIRIADDQYLVTTTTGNAAAVLDWFEEWLQTEWPELRVHCTSVTDEWATIALVGPQSREVLERVAQGLEVGATAFPFMTWRDAAVAGVPARVCRISFSGELAYEINVKAWYALGVWEALLAAGKDLQLTPYGTETMHVLRAEKGYPIVGQDTDGTVTPQDLGMSWVVSAKKADFIGLRSFSRADTRREDRKHLVGLLPAQPRLLLPEGAQLLARERFELPAPMIGHVTSSYRSVALGRTFALALVKGGRMRIGETIYASWGETVAPVVVTEPVLFDKEGTRRDG